MKFNCEDCEDTGVQTEGEFDEVLVVPCHCVKDVDGYDEMQG